MYVPRYLGGLRFSFTPTGRQPSFCCG